MTEFVSTLTSALDEALPAIRRVTSIAELEELRVRYLGRKGAISQLMKQLASLPAEQRPEAGQVANRVRAELSAELEKRAAELEAKTQTDWVDVTLPGRKRGVGYKHPVTRVIDEAVEIFRRMGFVAVTGPDIEDEFHNFDALNTPKDHPSRDLQDTFYLHDGRLLRTHTSPVQVRVMQHRPPPVRIVAPGRCYRRDTPDATHTMNFHQIEGLYVDERVSLADLKATLLRFAHEMFGKEIKLRFRPHFFPFTEPSLEYDFSCVNCGGKGCAVCKNSGWLEISGAGMVDPAVFTQVGYDPEKYTGYAFGMGIERIAMIRYKIGDIRLLYENDVRFLRQR